MKKILLSILLVMALVMSTALVACDGDSGSEYDDSESRLPVDTHAPESAPEDTEKETDSALGIVEDTEEGWSEIHR